MVKKLFLTALIVLILDQLTKFILKGNINTGIAFSLFQGYNLIFIFIAIIVILVILYYRNHPQQFSIGLLLGGTTSNLIDRIIHGGVIDFIHLIYWNTNIADFANVIGGFLLIKYFWQND